MRRTIFTLQRKNTTSSAKYEKSEVWWLLYNVNNLASNGLQTTLALAVALFDTPIKNIYWRSVAETDLKNVSTFISQLGTCNWNFYNQLLNFLNSEVLSSFDLFHFFEKEGDSLKTICITSTSSGVLLPCLPLFWLCCRATPFPEETAHPSKAHRNLENLSLDFNGCQSMAITLCCSLFNHFFVNWVTSVLSLQVYQFLCPCRNFTYFFPIQESFCQKVLWTPITSQALRKVFL